MKSLNIKFMINYLIIISISIQNITLNGNNPTLLHAYGGFGFSNTPNYNPLNAFFINDLKGVYALANIRGGGYVMCDSSPTN
jgi:prolyl oligopeptidase PreP (S9A serine peptidase family)